MQYLTLQINEGNTSINCAVACNESMQQHEIKKYVTNDLFERFDRQRLKLKALKFLMETKFPSRDLVFRLL